MTTTLTTTTIPKTTTSTQTQQELSGASEKHLLKTNIYNRISYKKQIHNNDINENNNKTATMTTVASGSVCLTFINHSLTQYEQLQK